MEFAARWRSAMSGARDLVRELTRARKPEELLQRLPNGPGLERLAREYRAAAEQRRKSAAPIRALLERNAATLAELEHLRAAAAALHRRRGAIRRERSVPARRRVWELQASEAEEVQLAAAYARLEDAETERGSVSARLEATEAKLQAARREQAQLREQLLSLVRSARHRRALAQYQEAVLQLEFARLEAVSEAYRALALERADHRPSWWWFPAIDPDGAWFARAAETATMRFEEFGE